MTKQLTLVPTPGWRFDDQTRAIGMVGVAKAREALEAARRHRAQLDQDSAAATEAA